MSEYIFVIDTDTYAGNFERQLCSFMTGVVGECGVGDDYAKLYYEDLKLPSDAPDPLADLIESEPDERGCHRPCAIYETPGFFNHGMGTEFKDGTPDDVVLADWTQKVEKSFAGNPVGKESFLRGRDVTKVSRFNAYLSVAIWLRHEPTKEQVALMIDRAKKFRKPEETSSFMHKTFKISGFRLLREERKVTLVEKFD